MPWELWRNNFIQTGDEALAHAAYERLVPDPYRPVFDPIRLRRPVHRELPTSFVVLRDDLSLGPGFWHPGMTDRLNGGRVIETDGDHEAMLTVPTRLAGALHKAAAAAAGRAA